MRHEDIQEEMPEDLRSEKGKMSITGMDLETTIRQVMTEPIRAELKML